MGFFSGLFGDFSGRHMKSEITMLPSPPPPTGGWSKPMAIFDASGSSTSGTGQSHGAGKTRVKRSLSYRNADGPAWQIGKKVMQVCPGIQEKLANKPSGPINEPCLSKFSPGEYYLVQQKPFGGLGYLGKGFIAGPLTVSYLFWKPGATTPASTSAPNVPKTMPDGSVVTSPAPLPPTVTFSTMTPQQRAAHPTGGMTKANLTPSEVSMFNMMNGSAADDFLKKVAKDRGLLGGYSFGGIRRPGHLGDLSDTWFRR